MNIEVNENDKGIIKTICEYGDKAKYLAEIFNESSILETIGIAIVNDTITGEKYIFLSNNLYDDYNEEIGIVYLSEMYKLIKQLEEGGYIRLTKSEDNFLVIGKKKSKWKAPGIISVENNKGEEETIYLQYRAIYWIDKLNRYCYSPLRLPEDIEPIFDLMNSYISIETKLKKFVKNNFKNETDIRYRKERFATWLSIIISTIIGILGIIF